MYGHPILRRSGQLCSSNHLAKSIHPEAAIVSIMLLIIVRRAQGTLQPSVNLSYCLEASPLDTESTGDKA